MNRWLCCERIVAPKLWVFKMTYHIIPPVPLNVLFYFNSCHHHSSEHQIKVRLRAHSSLCVSTHHQVCKPVSLHICASICMWYNSLAPAVCACVMCVCVCDAVAQSDRYTVVLRRRGWHTLTCSSTLFHRVLARSTQADSELPHTWPGPHAYGGGQREGKQE